MLYSFDSVSSNFTTLSVTDASFRIAKLFSALAFEDSLPEGVQAAVDGSGIYGESYVDAYALELSRELLAYTSSVFEPAQAQSVFVVETTLGASFQLIPLVLYLTTLILFWCVSLIHLETRSRSNRAFSSIPVSLHS